MKIARFRPSCHPLLIVAIALSVGCSDRGESPSKQPPDAIGDAPADKPQDTPQPLDLWLGQWNGPEGTFLIVAKNEDRYRITIQTLDGPTSYDAEAVGDHIEFERDGKRESIRATNGKDTGMKWLQDKTTCLTIKLGEGFCRD